jgi:hypothetical protein
MRLADHAWEEVTQSTIAHCWHKSRILPASLLSPSADSAASDLHPLAVVAPKPEPVKEADQAVKSVLKDLASTGVLQAVNCINLEDFIEPEGERQGMGDNETDKEIFDAVMKAKQASDMLEINGGDDAETQAIEPPPSFKEVLQASAVIQKYLLTQTDSYA